MKWGLCGYALQGKATLWLAGCSRIGVSFDPELNGKALTFFFCSGEGSVDNLIVNCQRVDFKRALGVPSFLLCLCNALTSNYNIVFWSDKRDQIEFLRQISPIENARYLSDKNDLIAFGKFIEVLPHHFQARTFDMKAVTICHDMHVFDISWKYNNHIELQEQYKRNLKDADAVFTEFPRTYYELERTIGDNLNSLFLTESPLLLYDQIHNYSNGQRTKIFTEDNGVPVFFYPAQRQRHKNHTRLIEATRYLTDCGYKFKVKCAGSSFDPVYDRELLALVKKNEVQDQFSFLGRISDKEIVKNYDECVAVVVPSLAEGGAYVALEAIAMGKPVCINRISSAQSHLQMVKGEVFWFDGANSMSIAKSMERVLAGDAKTLYSRNEIARSRIRDMTWEAVADKWRIVIDWLMGRRDRPILGTDKDTWNITYN